MKARSLLAGLFLATCVGLVEAGEFTAIIRRVEGKKVVVVVRDNQKLVEKDLAVNDMVSVFIAQIDPKTKKWVSAEKLDGGLENKQFKEAVKNSAKFRVTTDEADKVLEIRFLDPKQPPSKQEAGFISELSQNDSQAYDYLLAGIKESRDKMKSGVFRALGKFTQTPTIGDDKLAGDVYIYCAFDWPSGRLRFDRSYARANARRDGVKNEKNAPRTDSIVGEKTGLVFTPKEVIRLENDVLRIYSPDQDDVVKTIKPETFDVRALGMFGSADFEGGVWFGDIYRTLQTSRPRDIQRDASGLWKINWESMPHHILSTLWVEELKGFSVVRHEIRPKDKKDSSVWAKPADITEVTWAQHEGVFIPKTFVLKTYTRKKASQWDFAIEWEALNKSIPEKVFSLEGFQIEKRTSVVDMKTGTPVVTDVLKDTPEVSTGVEKTEAHRAHGVNTSIVWITIINSVFVLLIFGYFRYRRYRRAK